jgi:predicted nucleic acid-binding protein
VKGFLLDTNVLSEFSRTGDPDQRVDRWLKATAEESLFASVLTFAEIRRGIELLLSGKRRTQLEEWQEDLVASFEDRLLPVTKAIADRWAVLSAQAQRRGTPLSNIDGLIAATAMEHDLTLATRNVKDFAGLGVPIFNPWEA